MITDSQLLLHFSLPGSMARTREKTRVPQGSHSAPFTEAASSVSSVKSSEERRHSQDPQTLRLSVPWQLMLRESPETHPLHVQHTLGLSRRPASAHWLGTSSVGHALHRPSPGVHCQLPISSCSLTRHGGHHAVHQPAAALPARLLVPPSGLVTFDHIPYICSSCFVLTNLSPPESRAPSSFPLGSIQCTQEKYVLYRQSAAKDTDKEMDLDSVSTSRLQVHSPPPKHRPSIATR